MIQNTADITIGGKTFPIADLTFHYDYNDQTCESLRFTAIRDPKIVVDGSIDRIGIGIGSTANHEGKMRLIKEIRETNNHSLRMSLLKKLLVI